jgi:hypothetical protein
MARLIQIVRQPPPPFIPEFRSWLHRWTRCDSFGSHILKLLRETSLLFSRKQRGDIIFGRVEGALCCLRFDEISQYVWKMNVKSVVLHTLSVFHSQTASSCIPSGEL